LLSGQATEAKTAHAAVNLQLFAGHHRNTMASVDLT
jgi:hypothetical protein